MDVEELRRIIEMLEGTAIQKLELKREGAKLRITRNLGTFVEPAKFGSADLERAIVESGARTGAAASSAEPAIEEDAGLVKVESPIVGNFYSRPSPESDPFVEVGGRVKKGDTLCIVEAMKLMNEIEATVSGTIEKILLKDGQVVEYGEVLYLIKPD